MTLAFVVPAKRTLSTIGRFVKRSIIYFSLFFFTVHRISISLTVSFNLLREPAGLTCFTSLFFLISFIIVSAKFSASNNSILPRNFCWSCIPLSIFSSVFSPNPDIFLNLPFLAAVSNSFILVILRFS